MEESKENHKVKFLFSGKSNFYEVESSRSKEKYDVSIQLGCTCGGSGNPHNNVNIKSKGMCSHIEEVLKEIIKTKSMNLTMIPVTNQNKINTCLNLVRISNRKINEVRYSQGETP